ncbi:hypothetical protein [Chitinophaga sp. CF418]|uniref:hypothetical protein n=1 Tax=Chitinophaga sp. CF418 TaxID=1855287 RepID=UPI0009111D79|nr:hypothetical protein [Chitinophaga sp. CF418]SHN37563.1 hypothetical protein SAMN05216311_110257 [Chitinophaga sp. CF418]
MKNDTMEDKVNVFGKNQTADIPVKPPRLVSGKSSLAQFIRTKEQADELMEALNKAFNKVP